MTSSSEEILIVVDENDRVLDYLPRSEVHKKKLLHRTISVITFNSVGQIVLQKRSQSKDTYPGMLANGVGGHVIKGQTYDQAAKQETIEELGKSYTLKKVLKTIIENPEHRTMTVIYQTIADGPFKYNKDEIDEIVEIDPAKLKTNQDVLSPSLVLILKATDRWENL